MKNVHNAVTKTSGALYARWLLIALDRCSAVLCWTDVRERLMIQRDFTLRCLDYRTALVGCVDAHCSAVVWASWMIDSDRLAQMPTSPQARLDGRCSCLRHKRQESCHHFCTCIREHVSSRDKLSISQFQFNSDAIH